MTEVEERALARLLVNLVGHPKHSFVIRVLTVLSLRRVPNAPVVGVMAVSRAR